MKKPKTNDQCLKALIKETEGTIYSALLRERIVKVMEMTMDDINNNPDKWNNGFIHPNAFKELNNIIQTHLGFND